MTISPSSIRARPNDGSRSPLRNCTTLRKKYSTFTNQNSQKGDLIFKFYKNRILLLVQWFFSFASAFGGGPECNLQNFKKIALRPVPPPP
jgi:hypothetical protein